MDEAAKKILSRFEAQCSKREYCQSDIRQKIQKAISDKEMDPDIADEIMESLVKDKYVDDLRYASAFAREKSALTGWGPVKIRFALGAKRIDRATIDAALDEIDSERADKRLEKLLEAKWKTLKGDPQARLKLIKFALSRGYEYSDISSSVDRISKSAE